MQLSPAELILLRVVRLSDEDHGGLDAAELDADELESMRRLTALGLVEAVGEEDGDALSVVYRVTARGVAVLRDSPQ